MLKFFLNVLAYFGDFLCFLNTFEVLLDAAFDLEISFIELVVNVQQRQILCLKCFLYLFLKVGQHRCGCHLAQFVLNPGHGLKQLLGVSNLVKLILQLLEFLFSSQIFSF